MVNLSDNQIHMIYIINEVPLRPSELKEHFKIIKPVL